jgi:hypothetical protein
MVGMAYLAQIILYLNVQVAGSVGLIQPHGIIWGADFLSYWSAGKLALSGHAADVYNIDRMATIHKLASPDNMAVTAYHYPPFFLLVLAPLATLPYLVAYLLFISLTLGLWLALLWQLRPKISTVVMAMLFPGTWMCILAGQNAFLTAALAGYTLWSLTKNRINAGSIACTALLYKPQLALLPGCMTAWTALRQRRFETIFIGMASVLVLVVLTLLIFGAQSWIAFWHNSSYAVALLEESSIPLSTMISPFAALREQGASLPIAYMAQGLCALSSLIIVGRIWQKSTSASLNIAAVSSAILLISPHMFQYELPIFMLALVMMWQYAEEIGFLRGEACFLFLCFFAQPLLSSWMGNLSLYPLISISFMLYVFYRHICSMNRKCAKAEL